MGEVYVGLGDPEIENFHYLDPSVQQESRALFERMRRECPVARSERFGGFWVFSRYDDVFAAYQDPETFSSFPGNIPSGDLGNVRPLIPVEIDPPDHNGYKQILAPLFTAHRMRPLEDKIRGHCVALIDAVAEQGECDYVTVFAKELPARVFVELVGWPAADAPRFLAWADAAIRGVPGDEVASARVREEGSTALYGYFNAELDKRDAEGPPPGGTEVDLLDWLRQARFADERPLSRFEILDILFLMLVAGLDTTQGVLGFSMEFLAGHPEHQRQLAADPQLTESAVEELLRAFAPVQVCRRMTRDHVVRGVQLKEGDRLMMLTGSACRDSDEFPDPDVVDFHRKPNRHIAFGAGVHRCLGSHLARLTLRTAMQEWHRRIPEYRLKPGSTVIRHLAAVAGVDQLHLVWEPS